MDDLRYPIGRYVEQSYSEKQKTEWLLDIQALPKQLEYAVQDLDAVQLNTPYREGGWTLKQVVHHVADSHMNAYIRFKLGLTEEKPVIKTYDEKAWSELIDSETLPTNISLTLLYALHTRWSTIIGSMSETDFMKEVYHPEHKTHLSLWYLLGMYAWHSRHHVAHIMSLRQRMKW